MFKISNVQIKTLVDSFYEDVNKDPMLGPIFNEVAKVNWEEHLSLLYKFWSNIILGTREYQGNPYNKHVELAKKILIEEKHFKRWLSLFSKHLYNIIPQPNASEIEAKVTSIANALRKGMISNANFTSTSDQHNA